MCDNSRERDAAARQGFHGNRQERAGGRGLGLGRGALLAPGVLGVLKYKPGPIDDIAERLDSLTNGVLRPDGSELAGALQDLQREGLVECEVVQGPEYPCKSWRLSSEGRVRLLGVAERLRERARLSERLADLLAEDA